MCTLVRDISECILKYTFFVQTDVPYELISSFFYTCKLQYENSSADTDILNTNSAVRRKIWQLLFPLPTFLTHDAAELIDFHSGGAAETLPRENSPGETFSMQKLRGGGFVHFIWGTIP